MGKINKSTKNIHISKLDVDQKVVTDKGTFYVEQCNCGQKQLVPDGVCDYKCKRCGFKFIDCG